MTIKLDLMIIGAQKAGTTSLFRLLASHPQVVAHRQRELGYFISDREHARGWSNAERKYFPDSARTAGTIVAKDALGMYSIDALERLRGHNPDVAVVMLLREPVSRAYSAYWYARRRGWESLPSFESALASEADRLASDGWWRWRNNAYVQNGLYAAHIERVTNVFGRPPQVFLTEDLERNPQGVCDAIVRSLRLPPHEVIVTAPKNVAKVARSERVARMIDGLLNSTGAWRQTIRRAVPPSIATPVKHALLALNETQRALPPIAEETSLRLRQVFRASNEELEALLERRLTSWL